MYRREYIYIVHMLKNENVPVRVIHFIIHSIEGLVLSD